MKTQLLNSTIFGILPILTYIGFTIHASVGFAASSSATSRVGITKIVSLQVSNIEQTELVLSDSVQRMQTNTCFQSTGLDMPYRVSASSLSGRNQFFLKGDDSVIPYQVSWSKENDGRNAWVLESAKDQTGVLIASSSGHCALNTLSVQINNLAFHNASDDIYSDTLSLMLVIE